MFFLVLIIRAVFGFGHNYSHVELSQCCMLKVYECFEVSREACIVEV